MNKKDLIKHLHHPEQITLDDLSELEEVIEKYPYFSIGHSIHAKASELIGVAEKADSLRRSAVYTGSRPTLKKWMQQGAMGVFPQKPTIDTKNPITSEVASLSIPKPEKSVGNVGTKITFTEPPKPSSEKEVYQEVLENLKKLQTNLHVFDEAESELEEKLKAEEKEKKAKAAKKLIVKEADSIEKETKVEKSAPKAVAKKVVTKKETAPKTTQKKTESKTETTKKTTVKKTPAKSVQKKTKADSLANTEINSHSADILQDLMQMEGKVISNDKLKAQIDIIDKFIKAEPQIKRKTPNEAYEPSTSDVQDLTGDLSSLGDELLSENLAIILEKQGKHDRAIDIYKKLIWKFPQKKAYFAGRIEELKKLP